ncbi:MAG: PEP-CTERM sorting domain-containing protein [Myxococcota bacterium]|nr:PEP-CTERM sorting domain-containing protein [Myxococcota bacterium]
MTAMNRVFRSPMEREFSGSPLRWIESIFILIAMLLFTAGQANALFTFVVAENGPNCDPLGLATSAAGTATPIDELGTSAPFHLADEGITASASQTADFACPSSASAASGTQVLLSITNSTNRTFSDLWYVADPETSITNVDGDINFNPAFKIDGTVTVNLNNPLISESIFTDELFSPGETWKFIIDGYFNAVSAPASELGSIGAGSGSAEPGLTIPLSSGSIVALVPEPSTALLMGLGLAGLTLTGRQRSAQS